MADTGYTFAMPERPEVPLWRKTASDSYGPGISGVEGQPRAQTDEEKAEQIINEIDRSVQAATKFIAELNARMTANVEDNNRMAKLVGYLNQNIERSGR